MRNAVGPIADALWDLEKQLPGDLACVCGSSLIGSNCIMSRVISMIILDNIEIMALLLWRHHSLIICKKRVHSLSTADKTKQEGHYDGSRTGIITLT